MSCTPEGKLRLEKITTYGIAKKAYEGGDSVVVDFLFIVTPIVGVCNCSMFCCTLLYVHSSIAIILMGKRELVALLNLSSWCLVMIELLFLVVQWGCLWYFLIILTYYFTRLYLTLNCWL